MSAQPNPQMPAFNEAVEHFRKLLVSQQISSELLWVFREDVTSHKRRVLVKEPLPFENERIAALLYERGCQRGLGVQLDVFCLLGSRPCCYIWLPEDEYDAHYMIGNLKLSVPTDLLPARSVNSNLMWRVHVWLDERSGWNKAGERLPRRHI
jgi:hypothetical protein